MRCVAIAAILATTSFSTTAFAQANEAEAQRLVQECSKLAGRNAWAGVERCYENLVEMTDAVSFDMHMLGAQSARSLGKIQQVYERLSRAKEVDPQENVLSNLSAIDAGYARVKFDGKENLDVTLTPKVMPFAPDARRSIEWAQEVLENTGSFEGMLPIGEYTLTTPKEEFQLKLEAGPDVSKTTMKGGATVGIQWTGLTASLGYNFALSGAPGNPADVTEVHPATFSGSGFAADVGFEVGLSKQSGIAVAANLQYLGTFGSDTMHGGRAGLNFVLRPGDLRIAVGPTYTIRRAAGRGVADWFQSGRDPADLTYRGMSGAVGADLNVAYGFLDIGDSLQLAGMAGGGFAMDGERTYIDAGLRVGIIPQIGRFKE